MADPALPRDEWEMLAAEQALGVLDGPDRARASALELADADFAVAVEDWRLKFAPLCEAIAPVVPDAAIWPRIAARIAEDGGATIRQLHRWRAATAAVASIAAVLALILVLRPVPPAPVPPPLPTPSPAAQQPVMVAQLSGDQADMKVLARYDASQGMLHLDAQNLPAGTKKPELWIIPAGGAPHSLGEAPAEGAMAMPVDPAMRAMMAKGATLAVTMESPDGMPHAAPSSTPILAGTISLI